MYICYPCTWETEAEALQVPGQSPDKVSQTLPQKQKNRRSESVAQMTEHLVASMRLWVQSQVLPRGKK
jgi:hypothetical protein